MNLDFDFVELAASGFGRFRVVRAMDSQHSGWVGRFGRRQVDADSSSLEDLFQLGFKSFVAYFASRLTRGFYMSDENGLVLVAP